MNHKTRLTIVGVSLLALTLTAFVPTGTADNHDQFGTQVTIGDADFIPTLDRVWAWADGNVCFRDFGETNVQDFGFYLRPNAETTGDLQRFSIRLVEAQGHEAGSLVMSSHTAEQNQGCTSTGPMEFKYGDVNNNGRYDGGDYVWLTTGITTDDLDASSSGTQVTIRLTETNGGNAGTLVFSQDADYTSYSSNADDGINGNSRFGFHNADRSMSGGAHTLTSGDQVYLAIAEIGAETVPAVTAGGLIPMHSLRLHTDAGAYGSQVAVDDDDFIPLLNEIALAGSAFDTVCVVEFGGAANVNDFGFYLNPHGAITGGTTEVDSGFLRLRAIEGQEAGTRVRGTDTTEEGRVCDQGISPFGIHVADRNNNGRYDEGDWVFISTEDTVPGTGLAQSSSGTSWTIRLTETDSGAAGTLVFAGDSDFQSWASNTIAVAGGIGWGIFDQDRSGILGNDEILTNGDSVYLVRGMTTPASDLVPVYSIRMFGDAGDFGSQVVFGDNDFIPELAGPGTARICVVALGDGQNVADFGFYLYFGASQNSVPTNAVRLVSVEGNDAGSTVRDGDTTERGQGCEENHALSTTVTTGFGIHFTDRNNNGRYDEGDGLYLVSNTDGSSRADQLWASTSADRFTIRLTEVDSHAQGSLVFSGDSDFVSHGSSADDMTDADSIRYFDKDLSTAFTRGDSVYVQAGAPNDPELVQLYAVRVTGKLPVPGTGGPTDDDGTTDDGTTDGNATDDDATDDGTTDDGTTDDGTTDDDTTDDDEEATPAPAALVVLAVIGAALVALRRRG